MFAKHIANIGPSGKHLMEDFYYAGGLRALMTRLRDRLHLGARTVGGATLGEGIEGAAVHDDDVICTLDNAVYHEGSLAVLRGNLAPEPGFERGYGWMFAKHIRQANEGCDFDFLETGFGAPVDEPEIY